MSNKKPPIVTLVGYIILFSSTCLMTFLFLDFLNQANNKNKINPLVINTAENKFDENLVKELTVSVVDIVMHSDGCAANEALLTLKAVATLKPKATHSLSPSHSTAMITECQLKDHIQVLSSQSSYTYLPQHKSYKDLYYELTTLVPPALFFTNNNR